jgi:DMSO/TMAO reductase YedYZ molybdopterin-dependent catalytic subunit
MSTPTRRARSIGAAAIIALCVAVASAQAGRPASGSDAALVVAGDVPHPLTLTAADLKAMPRTTVTVTADGTDEKYEGVLVGAVLSRAGAPLGRDLTGHAVATYVLASAKDGYQVVFSLAELDPAFTANEIIIADTVDGKPLFDYQGPLRLVAPHDRRGARAVRMLQRLEVVRLRK